MGALKRDDDLGQEIGGRNSRGDDGQRAGDRLTKLADATRRLYQQRMRAEDVIGQELPGRCQLTPTRSTLDQLHPGLSLHLGDVLGDGGLTDLQLTRRRRE